MNTAPSDKASLKAAQAELIERFKAGRDIRLLVREWANAIDDVLRHAWLNLGLDQFNDLALLAVGGYGRAELHPASDVDVLILHDGTELPTGAEESVSQFITHLWDLGLDIGSSVRSLADCVRLATEDITIATNIMHASGG